MFTMGQSRNRLLLLLVIGVISCTIKDVFCQEGFMFTMSREIREGDTSRFCLSSYASNGDSRNISMSMMSMKGSSDTGIKVDDLYQHGVEKCQEFTAPPEGDYMLLLYNDTDIIHDGVEVKVKSHSLITLIQTDKPIYKPGQSVKFRILTIKSDKTPRTGNIKAVYIKNPDGSRVKQFLDVDSKGIASLEFQLSKETKLGTWQILVFLNETDPEASEDGFKSFEVKEYVLPRFEVKITPSVFVLARDELIEGEVCAKYTYGKNVSGILDMKVCGLRAGSEKGCHRETVEINGCYNFAANKTDFIKDEGFLAYHPLELMIDASVTDQANGVKVNASSRGPSITKKELILTFEDDTNGFYKPGLPFHGRVLVTKPDGQVAPNELIEVSAFDYDANIKFISNITSDELGVVKYSLCGDLSQNVTTLSMKAEAIEYQYKDDSVMYTPTGNDEIRQWFSPSFSYIQIPRAQTKQRCGTNMTLTIPFTTKVGTDVEFQYKIIVRGQVISTGIQVHRHNSTTSPPMSNIGAGSSCLTAETLPNIEPPPINPFLSNVEPDFIEKESVPNDYSNAYDLDSMDVFKDLEFEAIDFDNDEEFEILEDSDMDIPVPEPDTPAADMTPEEEMTIFPPDEPSDIPFKEPIVRSAILSDSVGSIDLNIPVTSLMAPSFVLLVHYVRVDGEVVADSMEFLVEPCFDNKVKMSFDKKRVLPGESVNLKLEAEAGSICGLGIVDKSVNILGGNHQITEQTIYDKIESHTVQKWSWYSYAEEKKYCEERVKEYIDEDSHFWNIYSRYVDSMEAYKNSGLLVLTNLKVETRPCQVSEAIYYSNTAEYSIDGMPGPMNNRASPSVRASDEVRSRFPETWLWDLQVVGENGTLDMPQVAPHTVTSWVGNAMCMDSAKGVGVSELQSLTTFQPFFIHLHLPYSAVRGERLPVLVTIYNYLDKCLNMQLSIDVGSGFTLVNNQALEPFCLCDGKSKTEKFYVTPKEVGSLPIIAKAEILAGTCKDNTTVIDLTYAGMTDAVKRNMFVKFEGVEREYTHTMYMCANDEESNKEDVILPLPEEIVKDSQRGEVKVIGDIMGPALTNLEHLVRMPTGCGEQNMVGFVPNIFVLKYLESTARLTEKIHHDSLKYMEAGYERELNYRHSDGSFSAFGPNDERGSVWLTAFVVKSFAQAKPYIYIDQQDLDKSIRFLKLSQAENGCFIETGKVISSYMMGGLGKKKSPVALTSYVMIALMEAGVNNTERVIKDGFSCINRKFRHASGTFDAYSLAISTYATTLRNSKSQMSAGFMKMLDAKANKDGSLKYWKREEVETTPSKSLYFEVATSAEVEMTSYALLAYNQFYGEGAVAHMHPIAMWLSHQRNPHGGFASTQDTVVGLNALSEFAIKAYIDTATSMNISVTSNYDEKLFTVSEKDNTKLLVQSKPLETIPVRLQIKASGEGCALVQASVRFNKLARNLGVSKPGFHLKVMTRRYRYDVDRCDKRSINIAVGSRMNRNHNTGMSLVMIKMVTSWTPIKDSLLKLKSQFITLGMKRYEHDEEQNVVTFYFDQLHRRPKEFTLDVEQDRDLKISSPKSAEVSVINYYEADISLVKTYSLKTICGTKQEIPIRRTLPPFDPRRPFPVQRRIGPPSVFRPLGAAPAMGFADETTACPMCEKVDISSLPSDFEQIICNASSVYKSIAGRTGKLPVKLREDITTRDRTTMNLFVDVSLPNECHCTLMQPPAQRIFIINGSLEKRVITLNSKSFVTKSSRKLEKLILDIRKRCQRG